MKRFRATVYHLSSTAACVIGDEGIRRFVVEEDAEDKHMFQARIRDRYIHDVDAEVDFGPISVVAQRRGRGDSPAPQR